MSNHSNKLEMSPEIKHGKIDCGHPNEKNIREGYLIRFGNELNNSVVQIWKKSKLYLNYLGDLLFRFSRK